LILREDKALQKEEQVQSFQADRESLLCSRNREDTYVAGEKMRPKQASDHLGAWRACYAFGILLFCSQSNNKVY
jgi:hypothetical protein